MGNDVNKKYFDALKTYLHEPTEHNLYLAYLLSSELIANEIGPDEIVGMHSTVVKEIVDKQPPITTVNYTMQSFTFLIEIMITYGLIHKKYLDERDDQIAQLKTYVNEIEELNEKLDSKINQAETIAMIANILTFENDDIERAIREVSGILHSIIPDSIVFYFNKDQEHQLIAFSNSKKKQLPVAVLKSIHSSYDSKDIILTKNEQYISVLLPFGHIANEILGIHFASTFIQPDTSFWIILKDLFRSFLDKMNLINRFKIQSLQDSMTGLFNYRYFKEYLHTMVKRHQSSSNVFSLMLIDIDDFKHINDSYGHLTGDVMLQRFAQLLAECTRANDILCRYGGDEFVIILPDTTAEQALKLGRRISSVVKNHKQSDFPGITISIGITEYQDGDSPAKLINRSDKGLYKAKQLGKNQVIISSAAG